MQPALLLKKVSSQAAVLLFSVQSRFLIN